MNILSKILIQIIKGYKFFISPLLGNNCRYFPNCSDYSIEVLKTYGFFKSIYMIMKRVLSCHPFNEGGIDPVKKEMEKK